MVYICVSDITLSLSFILKNILVWALDMSQHVRA